MLRPGLDEHDKNEALRLIREVLRTIISIGDVTLTDRKSDSRYVNIILDLSKIRQELQNANSNGRSNT